MADLIFVTHPEVIPDPGRPVTHWRLSASGIEHMRSFAETPIARGITRVCSSRETKAIEAAGLLAGALGIGIEVYADLGENDRSATGFLPPPEFEATASAFFAHPSESIRGWERAIDAQTRIRDAMRRILAHPGTGDIALVSHGAVGTLLLCHLLGEPISRSRDQPSQGHFWRASLPDLIVHHGWKPI